MSSSADQPQLGLGRSRRLRGPREFAVVREGGERRVCGCLILNWRRLPAGDRVRLGVITGRRLGGAVVRNRARRLLREAFRLHQHEVCGPAALVLVARLSLVGKPLSVVERDFRRCLREAGLWAGPKPEQD